MPTIAWTVPETGWFGHHQQPFPVWWDHMTRDGAQGDALGYLRDQLARLEAQHPEARSIVLRYPDGTAFMGFVRPHQQACSARSSARSTP